MKVKTPVQEFLDKIILKHVKDSAFLFPEVTIGEVEELLSKQELAITEAYKQGAIYGMNINGGCEWSDDDDDQCKEYFTNTFEK